MALQENTGTGNRLEELGGSDFEIADGQPHIKGWDVRDTAGTYIGEVDELLFDAATRKVLYLVLDLKGNELALDSRKILVPIGLATIHEKDDEVILAELTSKKLDALPAYEKGKVTPATEAVIRNTFCGLAAAAAAGASTYESHPEDFYSHEHFDQDRFYGNGTGAAATTIPVLEENLHIDKREIETGSERITSIITEIPVEENILLREEHVHVQRIPTDRPATEADFQTFKEGQIEMTETREVPVVSKQARVVEEVHIRKTVSETSETIRETLRRTEVDAERIDKDADPGAAFKA